MHKPFRRVSCKRPVVSAKAAADCSFSQSVFCHLYRPCAMPEWSRRRPSLSCIAARVGSNRSGCILTTHTSQARSLLGTAARWPCTSGHNATCGGRHMWKTRAAESEKRKSKAQKKTSKQVQVSLVCLFRCCFSFGDLFPPSPELVRPFLGFGGF